MKIGKFMLAALFLIQASIVATSSAEKAMGKEIKRLFTSESERDLIDEQREFGVNVNSTGSELSSGEEVNEEAIADNEALRFSGYITNSLGKNHVWIGGKSDLTTGIKQRSVKLVERGAHLLEISAETSESWLKPGQVWVDDKTPVLEGYLAPENTTAEVFEDMLTTESLENYEDLNTEVGEDSLIDQSIRNLEDLPVNDRIKQSLKQVQNSRQSEEKFLDKYFPSNSDSNKVEN